MGKRRNRESPEKEEQIDQETLQELKKSKMENTFSLGKNFTKKMESVDPKRLIVILERASLETVKVSSYSFNILLI